MKLMLMRDYIAHINSNTDVENKLEKITQYSELMNMNIIPSLFIPMKLNKSSFSYEELELIKIKENKELIQEYNNALTSILFLNWYIIYQDDCIIEIKTTNNKRITIMFLKKIKENDWMCKYNNNTLYHIEELINNNINLIK